MGCKASTVFINTVAHAYNNNQPNSNELLESNQIGNPGRKYCETDLAYFG